MGGLSHHLRTCLEATWGREGGAPPQPQVEILTLAAFLTKLRTDMCKGYTMAPLLRSSYHHHDHIMGV